jgi:cob(I)alamin adenosyltransferase
VVLARIYTRGGDDGFTGLIGGGRVPKDAARVDAYGSVDELNAALGLVCAHPLPARVQAILQRVQDDLFTVGANLALPENAKPEEWKISVLAEDDIAILEKTIDECEALLDPIDKFILPGGSAAGAMLHFARTVARRAERDCVALSHQEAINPRIIRYLNRLSDLCFVLARFVNRHLACAESHPTFGKRPAGA